MAVVVQTMVDARTAGVMFTRSPISGDRSVITIEGAWGLGSALVSGEVTPDHWVVAKITGEISVRDISDKAIRHAQAAAGGVEVLAVEESLRREPCLSDQELDSLRTVGRQIERHYGRPQDIEWAIDRHSQQILLLQSRPETVWSNKDSQVAADMRVSDPLQHVMKIFGGRTVTLTAADVAEIMRMVEQSKFDELNLEIDGIRLTLRRAGASAEFCPEHDDAIRSRGCRGRRCRRGSRDRRVGCALRNCGAGRCESQGHHIADARHILPSAEAWIRAIRRDRFGGATRTASSPSSKS